MIRKHIPTVVAWVGGAALAASVIGVTGMHNERRIVTGDPAYSSPAHPDNPTAMRGCVIRFDTLSETGNSQIPRIHANESHQCVGVSSVYADWSDAYRGDLVLKGIDTNRVVSISVTPDETMVALGIDCGPSGGGTTTRIRCYDRDGTKVPAYSLDLYGPTTNLWITWVMWMPEAVS